MADPHKHSAGSLAEAKGKGPPTRVAALSQDLRARALAHVRHVPRQDDEPALLFHVPLPGVAVLLDLASPLHGEARGHLLYDRVDVDPEHLLEEILEAVTVHGARIDGL